MSIESAIENAQQKVANAYTAVENKGGTLPATQNLSNLPTAINTISTAGTVETLNVTPSTSAQQFVPTGGVDGYNPVNVSAVTSDIDANITEGNIKNGVTILGVTGSVTELAGETRSVSLTNSAGQTFTPSSGKNGITSITVTPNNQARTVTPTTSQQSLTVGSGYSGNGTITVNAVTSSIDSDIIASNIKQGVNILGVNGSVVELKGETKTVTPTTSQQTITPSSGKNGITEVTVNAVTSSIDNNITAENIKDGVTILGVTGNFDPSPTIDSLSVTPSTSEQTFTASGGVDGYSPVTVSAVTSSIDSDIKATNIKSGVTILGVTGSVTELAGETRSVSITSTAGNTFTPSSGKNGITSITVTPTNQARTVTPTTSQQSITVNSGYSGNGTITVNAVTSAIDNNITEGNIKDGVTILGVTGNVTELNGETRTVSITSTSGNTFTPSSGKNGITSIKVTPTNKTLSITPSKTSQTKTVPTNYSGYGTVTCSAVTSSIDSNIQAGNIKSGVTILGVTGTYEGSGGGGGSSNFDLPSNMKIIKATSMTISYNNTDIDIENLETGDDVLPFLIFCCPEDDVENATDSDYDLTGGFFLSFCGRSYGINQQYSIGMNEGIARNTWYGKVFGVYQAGITLIDGSGSIECIEGGTSTISLLVTWDIP